MKAERSAQRRLLDLQAVDTTLAQLKHRRVSLPVHEAIKKVQLRRTRISESIVAAATIVSDTELELDKAEAALKPVRDRKSRDQRLIDSGSSSDPKAIAALIAEVDNLTKRIGDLEDAQLAVMERLDAMRAKHTDLVAQLGAVEAELRSLLQDRDAALSVLDAEIRQRQADRDAIAAEIPGPLLNKYEKTRTRLGGMGVGALVRRRCSGCQIELNAVDLVRYRAAAPDDVLECEECGRILVITSESEL